MPDPVKQKAIAVVCGLTLAWSGTAPETFARQHTDPPAKAQTCRTIHSSIYLSQFVLNGDDAAQAGALAENLWGTWLLQTALQHDEALQRMQARLNRVDGISTVLITGTSAVGIGQSIVSYSPNATLASNNLGLIGATAPFALLGVRTVLMSQLKKRIEQREHEIITNINQVLQDLTEGKPLAEVRATLAPQIGEQATLQFLKLWWLMESTPLPTFTPPPKETTP